MSAVAQFSLADGTTELVTVGSVRYRELLEDGHAPVGSVPESDGISDALEAFLDERGVGAVTTSLVPPPDGFTLNQLTIPQVLRLGGGRFRCLVEPLVDALRPTGGGVYYVAPDAPPANDGLTPATATYITTALGKPDVGTVVYLPGEYFRTNVTTKTDAGINHLAAGPGVRLTSWNDPASTTWTQHAGNVYVTSRSATHGVVDVENLTEWGDFTKYVKRADADSVTGPGEWAIVGSSVYVWAIGDTDLSVSANRGQLRLAVGASIGVQITDGVAYVRGIQFEGFVANGSGLRVEGNGLAIVEDCTFRYGMNTNGVNVDHGRGAILIRCEASSNDLDGFNYHGTGTVHPDFIEVDCRSHHNGLASPGSNNASTAHEQVKGVRVGGVYDVSGGPVVADVNQAKSWNLGCRAGDSVITAGNSWHVSATGFPDDGAEMWLDECTADTAPVAIRLTGGARAHLRGFRWSNLSATHADDSGTFLYY